MAKYLYTLLSGVILLLMTLTGTPCNASEHKFSSAIEPKAKGDACYNAGRFAEALEYYTESLNLAKADDEENIYYACIGNIGNIYADMHDYRRALHYYLKGYEASEENDNADMQWKFATNIVAVYCLMNDVGNARVFFKRQMSIPAGDVTLRKYYFLNNQSLMALAAGNDKMAEYYGRAALDYARDKGMPKQYAVSMGMSLGDIRLRRGDAAGAMRQYRQCRDSLVAQGDKRMLVSVYRNMTEAAAQMGDTALAAHYRARYLSLSDSVFDTSQFNIAASKLFEYENAENKKRVDALVSLNRIQTLVIVVFFVLAAALALLYVTLRRKNRLLLDARQALMRKNDELITSDRNSKRLLEQYVNAMNERRQEEQPPTTADPHTERNEIGLSPEQRNRLLNSITSVLENVEVISRSDFNLSTLASMVGTNTKYVSWIINDTYNKNFKTLLNEYRVREACRRLADREHYGNVTIQTIYQDLGYSSAAGFINAFRNVNGMTPSAYLKLVAARGK